MIRLLVGILLLAAPAASAAQSFPALSGRVVDQAQLLSPEQEEQLSARAEAIERASSRQLVVATVSSLEGQEIEDYANRLGRHWAIGQADIDNGVILLVAPAEKKVRIEVGYGLEGILTDALSSRMIRNDIVPRFRAGDVPGGIMAGAEAIAVQLEAPPEVAEAAAAQAAAEAREQNGDAGSLVPLIFWGIVLTFIIIPTIRRGFSGKRYRGRRRGGMPIVLWGPGSGGWGGSGGSFGGGSFGGGGFSGGGGSFGGGGASGGW